MGGKSGGSPEVPVTHYYMSVHFGICHGTLDSVNAIYFNDKLAWSSEIPDEAPPPDPSEGYYKVKGWDQSDAVRPGGDISFILLVGYKFEIPRERLVGGKLTWQEWELDPSTPPGSTRYKYVLGPVKERTIRALQGAWPDYGRGLHFEPSDPGPPPVWDDNIPKKPDRYGNKLGSAENLIIYPNNYSPPQPPEPPQPPSGDQFTIRIHQPELFGGKLKEGGVSGMVHIMKGSLGQTMPGNLAVKMGRTPETCPAYRGIANAFFYGSGDTSGQEGFYWSTNRNYLPDVSINVTRIPKGLAANTAAIGNDANPAHIIYECLTDTDWGMGAPVAAIDLGSFEQCANTLFNEHFGLSLMWADQMEIEGFINEILDHIEAVLFVHPRSGKFVLKLIRDDYDVDTLREFTPDNAFLKNFQRKAWGETINEITLTYKNPENEEDVSFTIQDNANIAMQGAVITDNRNYYGIRNADLAARVAERDLRAASAPLASCDIEVDRSAWDLTPGEVVLLTWPEYDLNKVVMRVGPIDYGRPGEPRIRASLFEDIFFMPEESIYTPPEPEWEDYRETALPVYLSRVITVPFYHTLRMLGINEQQGAQIAYPETLAGVLAASIQGDAQDYGLWGRSPTTTGSLEWEKFGQKQFRGYGFLLSDLTIQAHSYCHFDVITPKGGPVVGGFALIGDVDDFNSELVLIDDWDVDLGFRLRRAVLDTTAKEWPLDTPVWFFESGSDFTDHVGRFDGDTPTYRLLTRTSLNTLDIKYAPDVTGLLNGRPHYPLRPANVRLNNILWGHVLYNAIEFDSNGGYITLSWSTRNRLMETSVVLEWTDGSVPPEQGQVAKITLYDENGDVIWVKSHSSAQSQVIHFKDIPGPSATYKVESERDGHLSLQNTKHSFDVCGWGMSWGNYYGGKP